MQGPHISRHRVDRRHVLRLFLLAGLAAVPWRARRRIVVRNGWILRADDA